MTEMMQMNGMGQGGSAMMIVVLLFWLFVIGAVVWLVWRSLRGRSAGAGSSRDESAEEILKRRYARGEIDRSAYQRMRDDLHGGDAGP